MTRVLITGGASGLGQELARQYLAAGADVLVGDLAESSPDGVPAGVPEGAAYVTLDVRSDLDWEAAHDWVQREWGGLDILVNNAGIATGGRIDVETMTDWQRVMDINLLGVARGCRTFTPMLKAQRSGQIVNVASLAGFIHGPGMASYNAAKAAVVALSETLGFELGPWGIGVSAVCPSFFRTNLHTSLSGADTAMEKTALSLITEAPYTAEQVATAVIAGIEARESVIAPDEVAQTMIGTKLNDRAAYDAWGRDSGARLARRDLQS
jgi:NAD(P)-dependent dehydrogenase (short-subunit alcohol dehydrogenase family)